MSILILLLTVVIIMLWLFFAGLSKRIEAIERTLAAAMDRVQKLSAEIVALRQQSPADAAAEVPATEVVAPESPSTVVGGVPTETIAVAFTDATHASATAPLDDAPSAERIPSEAAAAAATAPTGRSLIDVGSEPLASTPAAASTVAGDQPAESWEMVVGASWLNKIGVLVFVMGVALLVGYSFAHIGPAGRVALGYALSAGLLATGVVLERRPGMRVYAYGLVGGGWAGLYFTTFAMHEVPAARSVESPLAAVSLLTAVAAGMIAHSLRYRSQVVTSLAYIVAYATIALSPLSGFALAASLPLAASLLIVSQRLGWPGLSVLGIVATYGAFAVRGALDPHSSLPYLMLAAYWLTFEAADLMGVRLRRLANAATVAARSIPMLALNAAGAMGALLVTLPANNPRLFSTCLFVAGAAHLGSAVTRARLSPKEVTSTPDERPFDHTHWATAIASALVAFGIGVRFTGNRESLALLLEAQLLFVSGFMLADSWIRRMASIVAALASVHALAICLLIDSGAIASVGAGMASAVAGLLAMIWYGNGEILYRRGVRLQWAEPAYAWMATALLGVIILVELDPAHQALAGLVLATVLAEASFRRDAGFAYQACIVGFFGSYAMLLAFLVPPDRTGQLSQWGVAPSLLDEWTVLPAGILIAAGVAWRLATRPVPEGTKSGRLAAASAAATAAVLFLLVFEWRVLPPTYIGPAWATTGIALIAFGLWRRLIGFRWQGYVVLLLGTARSAGSVFGTTDPSGQAIVLLSAVIVALYACGLAIGRATRAARAAGDPRRTEGTVAEAVSLGATGLLSLLILQEVRPSLVTLALGLQGLALMAAGLATRERVMRLSGLGLLLGCILKLFLYDLRELEALPRILSFVVLGLILLAISWVYTRYREYIRKLL